MLYGPQILFRGQPHGTLKFLFNGIVRAGMGESQAATVARAGNLTDWRKIPAQIGCTLKQMFHR